MTQAINQFAILPEQGDADLQVNGSVITCQVDAAQVTDLVAGQAVKLATTTGGVPKVLALSADTESPFGFVLRNVKNATFAAGANVEVAMQGSVVWMTAGATIARGAKLQTVIASTKVITNAGTNPVVGFALDGAATNGSLFRAYILTPSYELAQVIGDIAGLRYALDALGNGTTQIVTALSTVGNGTISAAGIAGGVVARSGTQTADITDTTVTAAALVAVLPNLSVNESFYFTYQNNTAFAVTIAGGSGITPSVQTVVKSGQWVKYLCTYTGTNTFTFVAVEAGQMNLIDGNTKICTAQVDRATSTTLTTVTGCSVPLAAGGKYLLRAHITGTATANGGAKVAFAGDGTLSATSFTVSARNYNAATLNAHTSTTTLGAAVGAATAVMTDVYLEGAIVVNAGGILNLQIAQNASHADTTSAYVNSTIEAIRIA